MTRSVLSLLLCLAIFAGCKETSKEKGQSSGIAAELSPEEQLYRQAVERDDVSTMLIAINQILLKDTLRKGLKDTLLRIYLQMGNPIACIDVAEDILKMQSNDDTAIMVAANSYASIGDAARAADMYERLYTLNNNPQFKLKAAEMYAELGDVENTLKATRMILQNRQVADSIKIEQVKPSDPNRTQKVKLSALAYMVEGMLYFNLGQAQKAEASFNEALKVDNMFDAPAFYLNEMRKMKKSKK